MWSRQHATHPYVPPMHRRREGTQYFLWLILARRVYCCWQVHKVESEEMENIPSPQVNGMRIRAVWLLTKECTGRLTLKSGSAWQNLKSESGKVCMIKEWMNEFLSQGVEVKGWLKVYKGMFYSCLIHIYCKVSSTRRGNRVHSCRRNGDSLLSSGSKVVLPKSHWVCRFVCQREVPKGIEWGWTVIEWKSGQCVW